MHFREWKVFSVDYNFIEVCYLGQIDNTPELAQVMAWSPETEEGKLSHYILPEVIMT